MKTIEEKAQEYAEAAFAKALKAPWPEAKQAFADTYLAGATEALAGQWRSVEDELPKEHDEVVVIFTHPYRPFITENIVAYWDGEDWYTIGGDHIRPSHWMPLPEPPKV